MAEFTIGNTNTYIFTTIASTIIIAISLLALKHTIKIPDKEFTSIFQGGVRYNSYIFIALSQLLCGDEGVALSGFFIACMIISKNVMNIISMNIYADNTNKGIAGATMALAKNPIIIAALTDMVLQLSEIQLSNVIKQFFTCLGKAATPLSLISAGAGLIIKSHNEEDFLYQSFMFRQAANKASHHNQYYSIFRLKRYWRRHRCSLFCNAYILASQMGGNHEIMASDITWTPLLSFITITIISGLFFFSLQL